MKRATQSDRRGTRSHWKDSNASAARQASGLRLKKWISTLAVLGLIALLVYVLWPPGVIRPHFAYVSVSQFESLLPPMVHAERDMQTLSRMEPARFASVRNLSGGTTSGNLFGDELSTLSGDALILYILTHGFTLPSDAVAPANPPGGIADQTAPLDAAASNPALRAVLIGSSSQPGVAGAEVASALKVANDCAANTKLVVLDVARIPSLPQEGMFANEMASHLDQELRREDDSGRNVYSDNLWVLLPNGLMETAAMDDGQSAFAQAFARALRGAADGSLDQDSDEYVTVGEVYAYVRRQLQSRRPRQTPLLFRGGAGALDADDVALATSPRLVSLFEEINDPRPTEGDETDESLRDTEAATGDAPPDGEATPSQVAASHSATDANAAASANPSAPGAVQEPNTPPETSPFQPNSEQNPAEGATDGASESSQSPQSLDNSAPPEAPPPWHVDRSGDAVLKTQERLAVELGRAWRLHNHLLAREEDGGWSPVDFAPLLWRNLEGQLILWERETLLHTPDNEGARQRVLRDVSDYVDWLSRVAEAIGRGQSLAGAARGSTDQQRLQAAWNGFLQATEADRSSWKQARTFINPQTGAPSLLVSAVVSRMDALRECADLTFAAGEYVALFDAACAADVAPDQLGQFARDLTDYLSEVRGVSIGLRDPVSSVRTGDPLTTDAITLQRRLHGHCRYLADRFDQQELSGAMSVEAAIAIRKANADPTASPGRSLPPKSIQDAVFGDVAFRERSQLRREVYQRFLELGFCEAELPELIIASGEGVPDKFLHSSRAVGRSVRDGFEELIQHVVKDVAGVQAPLAAHRARLLDARTIRMRAADLIRPNHYFSPPEIILPDKLIVSPTASSLRLDFTEPAQFAIDVGVFGPSETNSQAVLRFEEKLIRVERAGEALANGQSLPLTAGKNEIILAITALRQPTSPLPTPGEGLETEPVTKLSLSFEGERRGEPVEVACVLPLDRPLVLAAELAGDVPRPEGVRRPAGSWSDPIRLRPFPNRTSTFQFSLLNVSSAAKTVDLQLFTAREDLKYFRQLTQESGRRIPMEMYRQQVLGEDPQLLGEAKALTIAGGGASQPIAFKKGGAAAVGEPAPPDGTNGASADAAAGNPTGSPAPDNADDAPADVGNGLVCIVSDSASGREWLYFVELEPDPPNRFLQVDARIRQLGRSPVLEISVSPNSPIPGLGEENPILIAFSGDTNLAGRLNLLPRNQITQDGAAVLRFGIGQETEWRVLLDVGGKLGEQKEDVYYRRAFDLLITRQGDQVNVRDGRNDRREVRLDRVATIDAEGNAVRAFAGAEELKSAAFAIEDEPPTIRVEFHVDAPPTAFDRQADRVVLMARDRNLFEAHSDRQVTAMLLDVGETGLVLETKVEDFFCLWRPRESNAEVPLNLSLALAGEGREMQDVADVKLDAEPPQIRYFGSVNSGRNVPAGRLAVELDAADQWSGVSRVEIAKNVDPDALFAEGDPRPELSGVESALDETTGQFHWQALLPADLAKPGEKVRLVARVVDGVGHESTIASAEVIMPSPADAAAEQRGTIWGQVSYNGRPQKEIVVELEGPSGTRSEKLDSENRFYFAQLPAGVYTLRAEAEVVFQVAGRKTLAGEKPGIRFDPHSANRLRVDLNLDEAR